MNYTHGPAFSLSKSTKKSIYQMHQYNPIVPGPIYQVSGVGKKQPNLSFSPGKSKRLQINHGIEQTPSPMHYSPKKIQKALQKTIPKAYVINQKNENPDPSCYITNQHQTTKTVLAYTLNSRQPSIMDHHNKIPGPGHYLSQEILPILNRSKNVKQASFGTDSRFKNVEQNNPGVGNYQITTNKLSQFQLKYSMGKSQRSVSYKQAPGPTNYSKLSFAQQNLRNKIGKTLSGRFGSTFQSDKTTSNAFHKYLQDPQKMFITSKANPKYSLGKQRRDLFKPNSNPGPSQYINNLYLTKHSSTALMPTAQPTQHNDSLYKPGPGTYQIEKQKGITYSFPKSKSLATVSYNANPGVGRYKVEPNKSVKVNSFSKSKRFAKASPNGVGVGDYSIDYKHQLTKSLSKMSRSQRFKQATQSSPGPGDYHISSLISYKASTDKL